MKQKAINLEVNGPLPVRRADEISGVIRWQYEFDSMIESDDRRADVSLVINLLGALLLLTDCALDGGFTKATSYTARGVLLLCRIQRMMTRDISQHRLGLWQR